jgi:IMP dehydrogenase/GMP reductase
MNTTMYDWDDISLVPETLTSIKSRKDINIFNEDNMLPIMTAPMDTVVDLNNQDYFYSLGINVVLPRNLNLPKYFRDGVYKSISLYDAHKLYDNGFDFNNQSICIDMANGHMLDLLELTKKIVSSFPNQKLIIGNIANPDTFSLYADIGVWGIRLGIGAGQACLTSQQTAIHYPMASLINHCYAIKKQNNYKTKIIADGGFNKYSDIIKCLSFGSDYVMIGSLFNKALESCGDNYVFNRFKINNKTLLKYLYDKNIPIYKKYRGMSTKEVQKNWGKLRLTTSEGVVKRQKVEYTLDKWVDNFIDYLKSSMSYTNSKNLEEFKDSKFIFITNNSLNRFKK